MYCFFNKRTMTEGWSCFLNAVLLSTRAKKKDYTLSPSFVKSAHDGTAWVTTLETSPERALVAVRTNSHKAKRGGVGEGLKVAST